MSQMLLPGMRLKEQGWAASFWMKYSKPAKAMLKTHSCTLLYIGKLAGLLFISFRSGIYYRIENGMVAKIAVMHGSRDPDSWKTRT